jgi:DNA ligase 1
MSNIEFKGVLLAKDFSKVKHKKPITEYYASEKFDGYRAIWDGTKFMSRNGKTFTSTPQWFLDAMPKNVLLDGELWTKRDDFNTCGIFRKKNVVAGEWEKHNVKYKIFDMPLNNKPFESRMTDLNKLIQKQSTLIKKYQTTIPYNPLSITKQIKIKNQAHLDELYQNITKAKGEGIMLREAGSYYEHKRSNTLLKIKPVYDDECIIIGYNPGTGKYQGKLGSFKCVLLKNKDVHFKLSGMDDAIRSNYKTTHPIGTVVTFQYNELNNKTGAPRFGRYQRIRTDHGL